MLAAKARADKSYVEIGKDAIMTTVQPKNESSAFFVASSYLPGVIPPPSSRLTATLAVAMTWLTEAPQDKIISKKMGSDWVLQLLTGATMQSLHSSFLRSRC